MDSIAQEAHQLAIIDPRVPIRYSEVNQQRFVIAIATVEQFEANPKQNLTGFVLMFELAVKAISTIGSISFVKFAMAIAIIAATADSESHPFVNEISELIADSDLPCLVAEADSKVVSWLITVVVAAVATIEPAVVAIVQPTDVANSNFKIVLKLNSTTVSCPDSTAELTEAVALEVAVDRLSADKTVRIVA